MTMTIQNVPGLAAGVAIWAFSTTTYAAGVPINPGLWEFKTQNSMLGTEEVDQQCMRETVFDPAAILGDEEGCELSNEQVSGNTIDYDLTCVDEEQRGSASGHFSFTIDGDRGNGNVDLTFNVGEESVSSNTPWPPPASATAETRDGTAGFALNGPCTFGERRRQNAGAGCEILGLGVLRGIVADTALAGHEQHRRRADFGEEIGVMEGA